MQVITAWTSMRQSLPLQIVTAALPIFPSRTGSPYSHCPIRPTCHILVSSPTSWRNMGRSRSRSYSPSRRDRSPVRRRSRRNDDGPRRKFWRGRDLGPRFSSAPTSLLVRNIARDSRPEDLRLAFERFGPVKDVYLPKDYYSGEPRGFGFVQYLDPADASDAQYHMDRQLIAGREITVVFAEENRKKPAEMRVKERSSTPTSRGGRGHSDGRGGGFSGDGHRRRSPARRFRSGSRSRSPPSRRQTSRERVGARERRSRHGASPPGSPAKRLASPDGNEHATRKSWSRSLSPRAASSPSKSASP